jgi:ribosomal-protein-serine acetyltransferase
VFRIRLDGIIPQLPPNLKGDLRNCIAIALTDASRFTVIVRVSISISPELALRVLRPSDTGALFVLVQKNREHLRQWLPWVDATKSPLDSRRFLEMSYAGFQRGDGFSYGIQLDNRLVGLVGFHGFDRINRATSLGYWLARDACGRGIMRQAVAACVEFAFNDMHMHRLYIRCATGNSRSRRIPESLGFTLEGTQRQAEWLYDHFVDLQVYSLLAPEWRGTASLR